MSSPASTPTPVGSSSLARALALVAQQPLAAANRIVMLEARLAAVDPASPLLSAVTPTQQQHTECEKDQSPGSSRDRTPPPGEVIAGKMITMVTSTAMAPSVLETPVATMVTPGTVTPQPRHGEDEASSPLSPLHIHGSWGVAGDASRPNLSDVAAHPTARRTTPAEANSRQTRSQKIVPLSYMYDDEEVESDGEEDTVGDDANIGDTLADKHGVGADTSRGRPPSKTRKDPLHNLTARKQSEIGVTVKVKDRVVVNLDQALANSSDVVPTSPSRPSAPRSTKRTVHRIVSSDDETMDEHIMLDADVPLSQVKRPFPRSMKAAEVLEDTGPATLRKPWDLEPPNRIRADELAPSLVEEPNLRPRKLDGASDAEIPDLSEEQDKRDSMPGRPSLGGMSKRPRLRSRHTFGSDEDNDDDYDNSGDNKSDSNEDDDEATALTTSTKYATKSRRILELRNRPVLGEELGSQIGDPNMPLQTPRGGQILRPRSSRNSAAEDISPVQTERFRKSRRGSRILTRSQQRRTNKKTISVLDSDDEGSARTGSPSVVQIDVSDDEEEVCKPRKRARATRRTTRQSTLRSKVVDARSNSDESSSSDMKGFVIPDSEVDEESGADVDENDQPDDPLDANGPELHLGFRSLSQLSAGDPMETNQDVFKTYVTGHVLTFLDARFRGALVGKIDAHEFRGQIASLKLAIRRIEFDLMKSRASEFVADGRWRDVLHALDYRPFLTYFFGRLDMLPHPVDLQENLAVYWCVNEVKCQTD
jgi:hypothetical protein